MIRLEIIEGAAGAHVREFDEEIVNLGRAASNHLQIDNPYVSGEHGQIYISGERVYYCDLDSTNGSALRRDGQDSFFRSDKVEIRPGDQLLLGGEESGISLRLIGADLSDDLESTRTIVASRSVTQARELGDRLGGDSAAISVLFRLVRDLAESKSRTQILEQICKSLLEGWEPARMVCVYEVQGERLVPVVVRSIDGEEKTPAELPSAVRDKLEREKAAVLIELPGGKSAPGTGTGMLAPLLVRGALRGAIRVEVRVGAGSFGDRDLDLVTVFAAHAAKSLENIELVDALRASQARLADENKLLRTEANPHMEIVGEAPSMKAMLSQLERVIPTDTTVLVLGETGTGKELVARAIHQSGPRAEKLFVARNCGAIPENLLESELFGHVKGAFTGASENKRGVFDVADGGTVFLDEVGELPLSMQVKLLRVLQEGEIIPVGSAKGKHVNVRIVSATNRDLEKEVREGRFREDLYYRLNVFPVKVPALRERREDLGLLARHFMRKVGARLGRSNEEITDEAVLALQRYNWPGNVRELENEIERAGINAGPSEPVDVQHLSDRVLDAPENGAPAGEDGDETVIASTGTLKARLTEREKEIIRETLLHTEGNRTRAAEVLGISRQAFMKKISKYGIK
ncbi:MAG: sigma 54-interacting transcriptional regulator [Chrysiogenetes bacterium]|nr:sigma 54-interacting transcriptional regulator [Chrysiogenetes bacterium]